MRNFYKDIVFFFIIFSLLLGDIILFSNLINEFFVDSETIIAGIIGFVGAILGGAITYVGVRLQLSHRDKEIFLSTATERIINLSSLEDRYLSYNRRALNYAQQIHMDPERRNYQTGELVKEIIESIQQDRRTLIEEMGYSEYKEIMKIIGSIYRKIDGYIGKRPMTEDEAKEGIDEIQRLFKIISSYKSLILRKYENYTRH
ncbi:hypothetical protein [Bacillus paralicheniformis]|uniref:hypothetical protein n=1 Tax=Bacillus paralicheniformis TaxID=1648923 RepID=UPI000D039A47|nr:hypothetical protein [Bacillus paralicheniformis]